MLKFEKSDLDRSGYVKLLMEKSCLKMNYHIVQAFYVKIFRFPPNNCKLMLELNMKKKNLLNF